MEALLAFYFGWAMGSRSGPDGVDELRDALTALRQSEEFGALVVALRRHAAHIMRQVAGQLESSGTEPIGMPDVLARIYSLVNPSAN